MRSASSTDPALVLRSRLVRTAWVSCGVVVCALAWLGWTLRTSGAAENPAAEDRATDAERPIAAAAERGGVDLSVFNAAIWVAPAKPVEPAKVAASPPPAPPPPLKLQLVAIEEGEVPVVVMFDPESAKVLRGRVGERAGRYVVRSADADGVVLEDDEYPGKPKQTLRMKSRISLRPESGGLVK